MKKIYRKLFVIIAVAALAFCSVAFTACGGTETPPDGETHTHTWDVGTVKTEPTCVKNGVKEYRCTECGEIKEERIYATGHSYGEGEVTTDPKCEDTGVRTFTCTVCGATVTEDVDPIGHDYSTEGVVTTEPTCTQEGVTSYFCLRDGCESARTESIPVLGHTDEDHDGYCNRCSVFFGAKSWDITNFRYDGPWAGGVMGDANCYYYNLKTDGDPNILSIDTETKHGEAGTSLLLDFTNAPSASSPDGAWMVNIPVADLVAGTDYTVVFYAHTDGQFTGNLNKMLNNDNFGDMTCRNFAYDPVYSSEVLNGAEWTEVVVSFKANPYVNDGYCQFRVACDVGLDGWDGKLWLSDFTVYDSAYYKNLNAPADGLHHISTDAITFAPSYTIAKEGVTYWAYGLTDEEYNPFSVTTDVKYGSAENSIKATFRKDITATTDRPDGAYVIDVAMADLEYGEDYVLSYWAKADPGFTGNLKKQLCCETYTDSQHHTCANATYNQIEVNEEWQKVEVYFTAAHYDDSGFEDKDLCVWQIAFDMGTTGYDGTLYLSDFVVQKDVPDPGHGISTDSVAFASPWEISREGTTYWHNFGEEMTYNPFSVDAENAHGEAANSVKADFDPSITSTEGAAFMLHINMADLETGKDYVLNYWVKGDGFTGSIAKQLNNDNFTAVSSYPTPENPENNYITCANPELTGADAVTADWTQVSVKFTAYPDTAKNLCSWSIAFEPGETGIDGTLWVSDISVSAYEETGGTAVSYIAPYGITEAGLSYWAYGLSDQTDYNQPAHNPFSVVDDVVVDGEETSVRASFDPSVTSSSNGEYVFDIAMDGLENGRKYVFTYWAKASADFTGNIQKQLCDTTYTTDTFPTCTETDYTRVDLTEEWQKVEVTFTATFYPEDETYGTKDLCIWRIAFGVGEGISGTLWLSGFGVAPAA